jgi:predicted alpha/beta superfamily hydrolase
MNKAFGLASGLLVIGASVFSQNRIDKFSLESRSVEGETYPIEVVIPDDYDSTKIYPVIYFTDWFFSHGTGPAIYSRMRFVGAIEPIIFVGIGTEGHMKDWRMERWRDPTPTSVPRLDYPDSIAAGSRGKSGGAANFLSFIRDELIPLVEANYACDPMDRGLFGFSLGGLFGTYVLVSEPQLFHKYFLGSPTVRYDNFVMIEQLKETPSENYSSVKAVFVSVGEEEPGDYLKGFGDIRDLMLEKNVPGLKVGSYIVQGEGHLLSASPAIVKGLKFFYGSR